MPQRDLRDLSETLQGLVRHHGISSVLHSLADIQAALDQHSSLSRKRKHNAGSKPSAVDYVGKMTPSSREGKSQDACCATFRRRGFPSQYRRYL